MFAILAALALGPTVGPTAVLYTAAKVKSVAKACKQKSRKKVVPLSAKAGMVSSTMSEL